VKKEATIERLQLLCSCCVTALAWSIDSIIKPTTLKKEKNESKNENENQNESKNENENQNKSKNENENQNKSKNEN